MRNFFYITVFFKFLGLIENIEFRMNFSGRIYLQFFELWY